MKDIEKFVIFAIAMVLILFIAFFWVRSSKETPETPEQTPLVTPVPSDTITPDPVPTLPKAGFAPRGE